MYCISFRASASGVLLSFSPLATASLEESSLLFFIVARGVDGFSGVIAFYEPASRHSSHPGTVVFYGGVADFLAGFGTAFQDVARVLTRSGIRFRRRVALRSFRLCCWQGSGMYLNSPLRTSRASLTEKVVSFVEIIGN
ncbi:LOW QUALITY PROTEIN: hypothetical protein YC2023_001984 [Brassica napus]